MHPKILITTRLLAKTFVHVFEDGINTTMPLVTVEPHDHPVYYNTMVVGKHGASDVDPTNHWSPA